MNKALFYGAYSRANSYFQNTEYAARQYPDADELNPACTVETNFHLKLSHVYFSLRSQKAMGSIVTTCLKPASCWMRRDGR
jgi:hypothetical protein